MDGSKNTLYITIIYFHNKMIDFSPLNSVYGNNIPADLSDALKQLEEHLNKQKQYVKSVEILPNFSIDSERTIHLQKTFNKNIPFVLQGLVVTLAAEYKLSEDDAMWFHPEMAKGRSVYTLKNSILRKNLKNITETHHLSGTYNKEDPASISPFNCDIGEYTESKIDDMGLSTESKRLIVNVSAEALTFPQWSQYLMGGENCSKVYENWNTMDMGKGKSILATSLYIRNLIASKILNVSVDEAKTLKVYHDEVNALYSDGHHVYFANHAVKNPKDENSKLLVHMSALSGYELYSVNSDKLFLPSNMGISSETFSWENMTPNQRQRVFNDCIWEGDESFNTYVLSPPCMKGAEKEKMELTYNLTNPSKFRMNLAKFSSQPIRDYMDIDTLLKLTPTEKHLEGVNHDDLSARKKGSDICLQLDLEYEPFKKLIANIKEISKKYPDFKLFNEKIVDGEYIKIPREIVNNL